MAGIYRKFTVTGLTENQVRIFKDQMSEIDITGVTASSLSYDPATQVMEFSVGIDTEALPNGVTAADLRSRFRTYCQNKLAKLPDADIAVTDGSTGHTARDRGRQFLQAVADDIDPIEIGIDGPTLEARKETLRRYAKASQQHFGLPNATKR